jgi:DNA-binding response OmpR family regulator
MTQRSPAGTQGRVNSTAPRTNGEPTPTRVLIIVANALGNLVAVTLRHGSYETRHALSESEIATSMQDWQPHLAMVDIDHFQLGIEQVGGGMAKGGVPVLAFTRRRDTKVKLQAYEQGADDIIEVPFTLDEIVGRPYALIRRSRGINVRIVPKILLGGRLEVDLLEQTVKMDGGPQLDLTPTQQTLLYLLAANAGEVLTRETLLDSLWGSAFQIESNVVDRHIRELRVKLGDDWRTPRYLETIPGKGYRFTAKNGNGTAVASAAD